MNDYDMWCETLLALEPKLIDIVGPPFRPLQMVKAFHQIQAQWALCE
jgi:hypothetical protein